MQREIRYLIILLFLCGCAFARRDGDKMNFYGIGHAKWPDGAEIESKPIPDLPKVEIDQ